MQRLEVSGALRLIYRSLGVKGLGDDPNILNKTFDIITVTTFTAGKGLGKYRRKFVVPSLKVVIKIILSSSRNLK